MTEQISMIELFSGIGAQERALRQLGLPYEVRHTCDCDANAVLSYAAMRWDLEKEMKNFDFPSQQQMIEELQAKNLGYDFQNGKHRITSRTPITKLKQYYIADKLSNNLGDISKVKRLPYADLVTYSYPCFVPGTMVLTDNGYKNIEDIQDGDMVLTHTNQYQRVVKPMRNYCDSYVYKINAMCSDPICTTEEHPFYVRKRYFKYSLDCVYENGKEKKQRLFAEPEWVKAKDLTRDYYVGVAINQKSEIPKWDGMVFHWSDGRGDRYSNKLGRYMDKEDFWWVIGRYLGDGWLVDGYGKNPSYGIKICCANDETLEITTVLDKLDMHYVISTERTVNKIQLSGKELYAFCSQFGRGAENKHLTSTILNLPINLLKSFLDGYMSADGCFTQNKYKATSVSRELIYGLGQCVAKTYHVPFSIYRVKRPSTCVIEGRTVNQKDSYDITFKLERNKQDHAFYEDGYIWCPIKNISTEEYNGYVYNMEVENDNSYVVQNIIVHNCTDLSVAGKGEGMVNKCDKCGCSWSINFENPKVNNICPNCGNIDIKSTRSGLLGQVQRLLTVSYEENTLPRYLLLENVKNLVGKKFKPQFDAWLNWLDIIGYNTYYQVINGKHMGVPQNRERVFAISIRKDVDTKGFIFPETITLTTRLKDVLEKNVAEKYYLPDERVEKILNSTFIQEKMQSQMAEPEVNQLMNVMPGVNRSNPNQGRVYDVNGLAPTLTKMDGGNRQPFIIDEIKVIGNYMPSNHDASRVVDIDGIAPTVKENHGTVTAIAEPFIVASRGRNPENPSDRTPGSPTEQRLEPNFSGCTNTLTSVQKDNYVCEPQVLRAERTEYGKAIRKQYEAGEINEKIGNMREMKPRTDGVANTITSVQKDNYVVEAKEPIIYDDYNGRISSDQDAINTLTCNCGASAERNGVKIIEPFHIKWRIRKLTPKETTRLMNFTDRDYEAMAEYVSASAIYKADGNSIIVACLIAIMSSLFIKDGHKAEVWTKYALNYYD